MKKAHRSMNNKRAQKDRLAGKMFGITCILNDKKIYNKFLGGTVNKLEGHYIHEPVDNLDNKNFSSAASALNHGTKLLDKKSERSIDYYIFAHQDVAFVDRYWLNQTLKIFKDAGDAGVVGCAGMTSTGRFAGALSESWYSLQREKYMEVQTLDELILVTPKHVFNEIGGFDVETFTSWHAYGADYCLAVQDKGYKAYAMKNPVYHDSAGASIRTGTLNKEQDKLVKKWKHKHPTITCTCGKLFKTRTRPRHPAMRRRHNPRRSSRSQFNIKRGRNKKGHRRRGLTSMRRSHTHKKKKKRDIR